LTQFNSRKIATQHCDELNSESDALKLEILFYLFLITKTYMRPNVAPPARAS
jgi:hypothetical protein